MPFRSKKQMRFAFARKVPWAKRWAKETPEPKSLPESTKKKRRGKGK